MTRKPEMIVALLGFVLALAALIGLLGALLPRQAAAQPPVGTQGVRQITVVGTGEASGAPDTARAQLGVETRAATAGEALEANSTRMAALIARLKELGVKDEDIQTSGFNVGTDYDYEAGQIRGYTVSNSVSVVVRDLASLGELLDAAVQAGANNVYGLSFSVAEPKVLGEQARANAIADAQARAAQMAQAAGLSVGEVLAISESIGGPVPMPFAEAAMSQKAGAPIEPGLHGVSAQVQVTFVLR
jgi:uncharacterized protein